MLKHQPPKNLSSEYRAMTYFSLSADSEKDDIKQLQSNEMRMYSFIYI